MKVFDKSDNSKAIDCNLDILFAYYDFIFNIFTFCNNGIILSSINLYLDWSVSSIRSCISSMILLVKLISLLWIITNWSVEREKLELTENSFWTDWIDLMSFFFGRYMKP